MKWSHETFGDIFQRKRRITAKLIGIQKLLETKYSLFLINLQDTLIKELHQLLFQENEYWKLRSRTLWLQEGDQSTKFFHNSTNQRRRINKILGLKVDPTHNKCALIKNT